jgi:hypothetical protein
VALQGLYQWLLGGDDAGVIDAHLREQAEYAKCDQTHLDLLLHGCIREAACSTSCSPAMSIGRPRSFRPSSMVR